MLFSMRLPVAGLGAVYVAVCVLAAVEIGATSYVMLAALGAAVTLIRLALFQVYARTSPHGDLESLRRWERRYAIGTYMFAALLALLNIAALTVHYATSHLELVNEGQLWATIALTILLSTVVHGFTAGPVVDHIVRRQQRERA